MTPKFSAGLEYNPVTAEVRPRGTWFVTPMKGEWPSVVLGTSADRLSTAKGNAVFLTFTKAIRPEIFLFAGAKYGTHDRRFYFPFGVNIIPAPGWTFQTLYDGGHTHFLLSKSFGNTMASFVMARHRWPGIQIGIGF